MYAGNNSERKYCASCLTSYCHSMQGAVREGRGPGSFGNCPSSGGTLALESRQSHVSRVSAHLPSDGHSANLLESAFTTMGRGELSW